MLTAEQLQIQPSERTALAALRDALVAQQLPEHFQFTMAVSAAPTQDHPCGTAACIGGSVAIMVGMGAVSDPAFALEEPTFADMKRARAYVEECSKHATLAALFYPAPFGGTRVYPPYSIYTKEDAARAITNFLETGNPDWKTAAAGSIAAHEAKYKDDI